MFRIIGQVGLWADDTHRQPGRKPVTTNAGIQDRSLNPRIAADNQKGIRIVNTGNSGIEQIAGTRTANLCAILPAIQIPAADFAKQRFQRKHRFCIALVTGNGCDAAGLGLFQSGGNRRKGIIPACWCQLAVTPAHIGPVKTLASQAVNRIAGLVGNPFLIDVFIQSRQHPHDLRAARIDTDITAHRVHHIDRFGLCQFPRACSKGVRL